MNDNKHNLSHVPELDGIRGIAILLVMIFHIGNPIFKGGFIGVDIFFVLSGFLITSLLIKEYDTTHGINLKYFYMRRILRLAPALLIMLTILTVIGFLYFQPDIAINNFKSSLITLFYSSNWVRAFTLYNMGLLSHTWSLSIEEQFYILYPCILIFLLKFCKTRKQVTIILTMLAVCSWLLRIIFTINNYPAARIYNGLDTRADSLLTGCVLGLIINLDLLNKNNRRTRAIIQYIAAAAILCFCTILFSIGWSNLNVFYWVAFLVQVFTAFLILHVILPNSSLIKKLLRTRILVWIGSISYGLYLWHDPVYELIRMQGCSRWIIAIFGVTITFIIASLSFYILERPILKLKTKYTPNSVSGKSFVKILPQNKKVPSEEGTFSEYK